MEVIVSVAENKFNIHFKWNEELIDKVRTIPYRKWNPKYKVWEVPATEDNLIEIKEILQGDGVELILSPSVITWQQAKIEAKKEIRQFNKKLIAKSKQQKFNMKPYPHQLKGFNWLLGKPAGALFFECGLGKTKTILDVCNFYCKEKIIKKILVVCPLSVIASWQKEIKLHTDLNYTILYGTIEKRKRLLFEQTDIYIINYDAIRLMLPELEKAKFDVLICDESSYLKSHKSQRTRALTALSKKINYRYCLTGTPITQSIVSVFPQIRLLDPDVFGTNFYNFRNRYCKMGGYDNKEIVDYYNLKEFHEKLASISITYLKKDCLGLPTKVYEERNYELSKEQKKLYTEMSYFLVAQIKEGVQMTAQVVLTKLLRLQQIISGFGTDGDKTTRLKDNPKLKLLQETLEELQGKTVIWCRFIEDVAIICKNIQGCVSFQGGMNLKERQETLDMFNNNPAVKYLVMTSAGGYGLNLQVANNMIFYSHDFSLEKRLQAEDRIHRYGQKGTVTIINLVAKNTFEQEIVKCVSGKRDFSKYVMNNLSELVEKL